MVVVNGVIEVMIVGCVVYVLIFDFDVIVVVLLYFNYVGVYMVVDLLWFYG